MSTILSGPTPRQATTGAANAPSATPRVSKPSRDDLLRDLHWTRPNGVACFLANEPRSVIEARQRQLGEAVGELDDVELFATWKAATMRKGKAATAFKGSPKPAASFHAESLQSTVLRTDWSPTAVQIAVDWSQPAIRCEFAIGRDVVASGPMTSRVTMNGRECPVVDEWREVCWISDEEADYLELETTLADGLRLQRQFILLRRDGLAYMADAVLNRDRADIECEWSLPTVPTMKWTQAEETRDVQAAFGRRNFLVLPAALPEWRAERADGEVTADERGLSLRQSARESVALYAPLCLIVDSRRARRECTWRRLTIGENLQIQPADKAVGFRLQAGREQWLVYRSLTPRANRTVLGVNLQTNFLFSRFKPDGDSDTLIEVED